MNDSSGTGDVLVITTLDYTVEKNQRCQHVARALAERYGGAVVISKHRNVSVGFCERIRKLMPGLTVYRHGALKVYDLNPVLNQSFARPFRLLGPVSELMIVVSMLFLFLTNIRRRFSLCYAEGPWEMLVAAVLRAFGRVGGVVYGDIDYVPAFQVRPLRAFVTETVENFFIPRADLVVCTGSLLAAKRERDLGIRPVVIHNGVNYHAFSAGAEKEAHPPTIIYFGNFDERYSGISIALEGFMRIREKVTDARMILIGPDPDGRLAGRIRSLGIEEAVTKSGAVPYIELPFYIRKADIGYALFPPNPLRIFAFPLKVIEYMAGGLVVIGTERTETEIILKKYGSGVVIPFDMDRYVETVVDLFSRPDELRRMADNGVRGAAEFDWGLLMDDLIRSVEPVYERSSK